MEGTKGVKMDTIEKLTYQTRHVRKKKKKTLTSQLHTEKRKEKGQVQLTKKTIQKGD